MGVLGGVNERLFDCILHDSRFGNLPHQLASLLIFRNIGQHAIKILLKDSKESRTKESRVRIILLANCCDDLLAFACVVIMVVIMVVCLRTLPCAAKSDPLPHRIGTRTRFADFYRADLIPK